MKRFLVGEYGGLEAVEDTRTGDVVCLCDYVTDAERIAELLEIYGRVPMVDLFGSVTVPGVMATVDAWIESAIAAALSEPVGGGDFMPVQELPTHDLRGLSSP